LKVFDVIIELFLHFVLVVRHFFFWALFQNGLNSLHDVKFFLYFYFSLLSVLPNDSHSEAPSRPLLACNIYAPPFFFFFLFISSFQMPTIQLLLNFLFRDACLDGFDVIIELFLHFVLVVKLSLLVKFQQSSFFLVFHYWSACLESLELCICVRSNSLRDV